MAKTGSVTVRVRGNVRALFFVGDLPFSEEAIDQLGGYVARIDMDDIYLRDIPEAIGAAAEAMRKFEVKP